MKKATSLFKWINEHKFILSFVMNVIMIMLFIVTAKGMISFILEETLQQQGFGYAIPAMNKEFRLALAALENEEPYLRANIAMLKNVWNPITGKAFRCYADATLRKMERDKSFFQYMIQKQEKQAYADLRRR